MHVSSCLLINSNRMILSGSNYFPYRPEVNLAFERDYKSFPEYISGDTTYYGHRETAYNYTQAVNTAAVSRKPQMGVLASNHRRTMSSVSSNVNQGFQLENDELAAIYNYTNKQHSADNTKNRMNVYENMPFVQNYFPMTTPNADYTIAAIDRPSSLPFDTSCGTKLRSSLKKHSISGSTRTTPNYANGSNCVGSVVGMVSQHKATTPTNPTPPDSLTSDDSTYLSAKDGSISSQSRVRFSPESILEQSSINGPTAASQFIRRPSTTRHSISDTFAQATS